MKVNLLKLSPLIGMLVTASLSLNAQAIHVNMKPGLWEHTFNLTQGSIGDLAGVKQEQMSQAMEEVKKQMANMSPEQRQMMEDVMAKQGIKLSDKGIDMPSQNLQISKDGTILKVCLTQAQIDSGDLPQPENCEQKITQVSASVLTSSFVCKGEYPSHGEGQIIFQNDKAYTGTTKLTTEVNKKMQTIEGTQSGKWLSSDCGNIKPLSPKVK